MYNSVLRGYLNYYKFADNYGKLVSTLVIVLKSSCAKLLAAKYSLGTMAKTYKKFGHQLAEPNNSVEPVKAKKGKTKEVSFLNSSYAMSIKFLTKNTSIIAATYGSKSLATLDGLVSS